MPEKYFTPVSLFSVHDASMSRVIDGGAPHFAGKPTVHGPDNVANCVSVVAGTLWDVSLVGFRKTTKTVPHGSRLSGTVVWPSAIVKDTGSVLPVSAYQSSGSFSGYAERGLDMRAVIAAVVDEIQIAARQLAVEEFDSIVAAGVLKVRSDVHRLQRCRSVIAGIHGAFANGMRAGAIAKQCIVELLELRRIVGQTRIVCRLWPRHQRAPLYQFVDGLQYGQRHMLAVRIEHQQPVSRRRKYSLGFISQPRPRKGGGGQTCGSRDRPPTCCPAGCRASTTRRSAAIACSSRVALEHATEDQRPQRPGGPRYASTV